MLFFLLQQVDRIHTKSNTKDGNAQPAVNAAYAVDEKDGHFVNVEDKSTPL